MEDKVAVADFWPSPIAFSRLITNLEEIGSDDVGRTRFQRGAA